MLRVSRYLSSTSVRTQWCWEVHQIQPATENLQHDPKHYTKHSPTQGKYNKNHYMKNKIWTFGHEIFPLYHPAFAKDCQPGVGELWGIKSFYHEYWFKWRLLECAMLWVLLLTRIRYYSPLALLNGDTSTIPTFFFKSQNQAFKRPFNTEFWRKMLRHED